MEYVRHHMSIDIEGMLSRYRKKSMRGLLTEENGAEWTDKMVREYLTECLEKGWKKIPMGDCNGFDYFDKGCPGHPITEEEYNKNERNKV